MRISRYFESLLEAKKLHKMDQREIKEAKELNRLLGEKLSEAYKEMARMRANNSFQDKRFADAVDELKKDLESAEAKSDKYERKVTVLKKKLDEQKRQKTGLRIELNRMRAKMEELEISTMSASITSTELNADWSTGERLTDSISNQAKITPKSVFKVSPRFI